MLRILFGKMSPVCRQYAGSVRLCSQMKLPTLFDRDGNLVPLDDKMDYFQMFGLERKFNIEVIELSKTFKSLQTNLHPDKFVNARQQNIAESENWSAAVNHGYRLLQKPISRALYLLELAGYPLTEDSVTLEPDFLMDIMNLNEDVADADQNQVKILEDNIQETINEFIFTIDILFANEEFERAREEVAKMKYYSNVLDKIYEKQSEFGIY